MKKTLLYLLALTTFDAIVNGGMVAALSADSWTENDQGATDSYIFGYGVIVLYGLSRLWMQDKKSAQWCGILFLGYCEDTLYFLLKILFSPLIWLISGYSPDGSIFPESVSGWIGWIARVIFQNSISLPILAVFILNAVSILVVLNLFMKTKRQK